MYHDVRPEWNAFLFFSIGYLLLLALSIFVVVSRLFRFLSARPQYFFLLVPMAFLPIAVAFLLLYYAVLPFPKGALTYGSIMSVTGYAVLRVFHACSMMLLKRQHRTKKSKLHKETEPHTATET
jgi:hypothetical protein